MSSKLVTPDEGFEAKLIIWDLDDTLWQGTLAEGHDLNLNARRAAFVRTLNRRGIVSAICSKNDFAKAKVALEGFGLWEEFVFPRIAFAPKGPAIKQMIADMQLRAANVLFIDDNPHNLHEVAHTVPGIHVLDANSAACDLLLQKIADDHAHISKSRVGDYRVLEQRLGDRTQHADMSDEAFLMQSQIRATFLHRSDAIEFLGRIVELINRSNQLNYTESRVEPDLLLSQISAVLHYEALCVFVWDKYGYYGLVGVAVIDKRSREVLHFALSCRIMNMGVEDYLMTQLLRRYGEVDLRHLRKPLPAQSSRSITHTDFFEPGVWEYILSQETTRDPDNVDLRVMADCQSGMISHYSCFRDIIEYDNAPRFFCLPMLVLGCAAQNFPQYLVYTAAMDYVEVTWSYLLLKREFRVYVQCVETFCRIVVGGDHKLLIFLPPLDAPRELYRDCADRPNAHCSFSWEFGELANDLWRGMAARFPDHIVCMDQTGQIAPEDMLDTNHYRPSALRKMASQVDDWYAQQTGASIPQDSGGDGAVSLRPDLTKVAERRPLRAYPPACLRRRPCASETPTDRGTSPAGVATLALCTLTGKGVMT